MSGNSISVVKVRDVLMVTLPADPDDTVIMDLQQGTLESMEKHQAKALILDISAVEILDSFFARTISETAQMVSLMGGRTIIVGMRPSVAITAVQLGLALKRVETALSVDQALDRVAAAKPQGETPMSATVDVAVEIRTESDIVAARRTVREAAHALGFGMTDVTRIVTAASELARNVFKYAGSGVMVLHELDTGDGIGLELTFVDHGPGIADLSKAMEEGYSTSGGLGLGLPGAKRLMDEMEIRSAVGCGTTVILRKWRKP